MPAKTRISYVCQSCGAVFIRWSGRCTDCGEWNTLAEEEAAVGGGRAVPASRSDEPVAVTHAAGEIPRRIATGDSECDRVLGGGIVPGSITLIGGDPGIGKSTLMLQISHYVAEHEGDVLYVSGEESFNQTRLRAQRLGRLSNRLFILTETQVEAIQARLKQGDYALVVVDSIQSVYTAQLPGVPGSVGQVRDCANEFLRIAKGLDIPILLVGHVTKDGSIAGPRLLEHLVDTVLYFEGEGRQALRILRAVKNRFGSTNEIGVFEMGDAGLREVPNPSALFLDQRPNGVSGSVVVPGIEGTRPLLVEIQALVGDASYGSARRSVTGVNPNRVSLVLAVLEKRAGLHFSDKDVFVNAVGGVRLDEPAADLAVALALASSMREIPLHSSAAAFGEVGLAGEVRAVDLPRQRAAEARKFGFDRLVLPRSCAADVEGAGDGLLAVNSVEQALEAAFDH